MAVARTMMLHSAIHWPDVADPILWPLAFKHAVFLVNHKPDPRTGLSPHDVFTKTRWEQKKLMDVHVWGCPVYVLDKMISDGKKLPRWTPRSTGTSILDSPTNTPVRSLSFSTRRPFISLHSFTSYSTIGSPRFLLPLTTFRTSTMIAGGECFKTRRSNTSSTTKTKKD